MAFCIVYSRKELKTLTTGYGFYCFCAGAAAGIPADVIPADAIPVEIRPADVTNQNRSAPEDRRVDVSQADACLLNPSARHHLLRDLPARHSMTVGDSFPYDKNRGCSILCPGSFSFYTKIQEDRCAKHHRITVPDQSCRSQQTGSHIRPKWQHP